MGDVSTDVVVVGAGPAGLGAAVAAAKAGVRVVLLDAAAVAGGQIWRARRGVVNVEVEGLLGEAARAGVRVLAGARVVMPLPVPVPGMGLLADTPGGACRIAARRVILATGARERLLPFPGWTLPGVFGAGGLQALAKGGWPVEGRRVVIAGSGPLLLAAAATLRADGAHVVALAQEAAWSSLLRFGAALARHPRQAWAAAKLGVALAGVPVFAGTRVVAAEGDGRVERVRLATPAGERVVECDALAASWGLVPQAELAEALGCVLAPRFGARAVVVDASQRTSVADVFAAGECCGVAGVEAARVQGAIAGAAAARDLGARPVVETRWPSRLAREFRFADAVFATFPVPADWRGRLRDDTLVCRCEDVAWAALRDAPDLRAGKLATRCGMGYCQGRVCHDALAVIAPRERLPVRTPLVPVPLSTFLAAAPRRASESATEPSIDSPKEEPLP